jgi:hypothetical protein
MHRGGGGTRKEEKKEFVLLLPFCRTAPLCYTEHLTKIRNSQCGKKRHAVGGYCSNFKLVYFYSLLLLFLII